MVAITIIMSGVHHNVIIVHCRIKIALLIRQWSYKKSQRRDNIGIPPLLNEKGELCEDAEDKAKILSRQYTSVFTQDNPLEPVPDVPYSLPSMPDINIEENGILKLLKEVNVYKAIGPDLIPNRILKDCCVELAPILTQI